VAPLASLVLPTRNRARFLARTLASLTRQTERAFEVVIADDGSDDDTRDVARAYADRLDVRYLRRAARGIAPARNAAIREARGDLLINIDDDRVASRTFVADHLAAHADGVPRLVGGTLRGLFAAWDPLFAYAPADVASLLSRRPELAATLLGAGAELVTPAMIEADLDAVLRDFAIPETFFESWARPAIAAHGLDLDGFPFPWAVPVAGNLSVPRALALSVGLMDESFVGWGLDDAELSYRLWRTGARVRILDGGTSYHQVHRRGPELHRQWAGNAVRFLTRHGALDVCLYLAVHGGRLTLPAAAAILREHATLGGGAPAVTAELVRLHRESWRAAAA
jgi:glycosyltransferase involved in cell wall biosynthesis